ncbi:Ser/Thr protein phosphatase family protein, partial [Listeria marthii FSL S4-120]
GGTTTTEDPTTSTPNTTKPGTSSNANLPTTGDTAGLATVFGIILTTTALYVLRKRS